MIPVCEAFWQAYYKDLDNPLEDGQCISLKGQDGSTMRRVNTSNFKVLVEGVIPEPTKYSLYSEFLFPKLDDVKEQGFKGGRWWFYIWVV